MQIKLLYNRRKTSNVQVGNIFIGSDYPIRVQTMANTNTNDIDASVDQARRCIEAGAELLRYTTQGLREVESLREIHAQVLTAVPIVADVHFQADVADAAAQTVEAVRINPGNYCKDPSKLEERFVHLLDIRTQDSSHPLRIILYLLKLIKYYDVLLFGCLQITEQFIKRYSGHLSRCCPDTWKCYLACHRVVRSERGIDTLQHLLEIPFDLGRAGKRGVNELVLKSYMEIAGIFCSKEIDI